VESNSCPTARGIGSVANGAGPLGIVGATTKSANGGAKYKGESMSNQPFNNNATQAERRQVARDSYHWRAQVHQALAVGEVAAELGPVYPRLPATSPWANDPVPTEPPLGYAIDTMERE
jgi:hypothetical protein